MATSHHTRIHDLISCTPGSECGLISLWNRLSWLWPYCHFALDIFLLWGWLSCKVFGSIPGPYAIYAVTYPFPVSQPWQSNMSLDIAKCLWWGERDREQNHPQLRTTDLKGSSPTLLMIGSRIRMWPLWGNDLEREVWGRLWENLPHFSGNVTGSDHVFLPLNIITDRQESWACCGPAWERSQAWNLRHLQTSGYGERIHFFIVRDS